MSDYLVRATAADAAIRAFAVSTLDTVEEARARHNLSPVASAALGRLLTAGVMMGGMLKNEDDLVTLRIDGDGPIGSIVVTADSRGEVKGFAANPSVMLPPSPAGKLDVGGSIGNGVLTVIKDMGLKEPYSGQVVLQTGEIAEDLTYYFATSEQVPSSVGLGVLMNRQDATVKRAGGFIIQLMPFASDEVLSKLEENIKSLKPVTTMLDLGLTPEEVLGEVLKGFDIEITDTMPVGFKCNCSKDRLTKALISLGRKEIKSIIDDGKPITMNCHFCNTDYTFEIDELKDIYKKIK